MVQNKPLNTSYHKLRKKMFNKDNLITGIGSVVDLFGIQSFYRYYDFSDEHGTSADYDALKSDWITIGNDISHAMELFVSHNIKNRVRDD